MSATGDPAVVKPEIPTGPIETAPCPDLAWLRHRQVYPYTGAVRARHAREDREIILDELAAAGVELGADELRTVAWLANWEYEVLVTIASWIKRAHATGRQEVTDGPSHVG